MFFSLTSGDSICSIFLTWAYICYRKCIVKYLWDMGKGVFFFLLNVKPDLQIGPSFNAMAKKQSDL